MYLVNKKFWFLFIYLFICKLKTTVHCKFVYYDFHPCVNHNQCLHYLRPQGGAIDAGQTSFLSKRGLFQTVMILSLLIKNLYIYLLIA